MIVRSFNRRRVSGRALARWLVVTATAALLMPAPGTRAADRPARVRSDVPFELQHPRLLFDAFSLDGLRAKVRDGGPDDDAYGFIRSQFENVYTGAPWDSLLRDDFAQEQIVNIALSAYLEQPVDSSALELGRELTLHIARTFAVNTDAWGSSLRLRALSIGYDCFFGVATDAERDEVRTEVTGYITYMTTNINYDIWRHRPYVSNKTAMVSAALGLAAIAFEGDITASYTDGALAKAEEFLHAWHDSHLAGDGAYREGSLYAGWSLRNLIYYFHARKRFDGYDYSLDSAIRSVERWLAYELDPRGDARLNNIQDQTDHFRPLARHTTYLDWALGNWGSGLAAYLWDHAAGPFGRDMGDDADKAGTVLWHRSVPPVDPATELPLSAVWPSRGLYYFRTGWPAQSNSDDVVFSFFSGEFRGGHAQEEQNQFTLAAYGEKLIVDHGSGSLARQTEAHNLIRIDGLGQHNAGASIGTDGAIAAYLTSGFADYVRGDATLAYSTHSPYNDAGNPYPWTDWSWGLTGANPVERALRHVLTIHGPDAVPYFFIHDDIKKDDAPHLYDWCVHVPWNASVDASNDPVTVAVGGARLDIHAVNPARASLTASVSNFDNYAEDPNSRLVKLSVNDVSPEFGFLLIPREAEALSPVVTREPMAWGVATTVAWPGGGVDHLHQRAEWDSSASAVLTGATACDGPVATDAALGVMRTIADDVVGYLVVDATVAACGTRELVRVFDGPLTVAYDGARIHIDRLEADFRIHTGTATDVYCRGQRVSTIRDGDYFTNAAITSVAARGAGALALRAFPNPFNPSVRVAFHNPARSRVTMDVFDAAGRRVASVLDRVLGAGEQVLSWDGRGRDGRGLASGVYFARVSAGSDTQTIKLVLLR